MKFVLALLATIISLNVHAASVQVTVNGEVYTCTNSNGNGDDGDCRGAALMAEKKFAACKAAGNYPSSCFDKSYRPKVSNCALWSEGCNNTCKVAGNYASSCFDMCF